MSPQDTQSHDLDAVVRTVAEAVLSRLRLDSGAGGTPSDAHGTAPGVQGGVLGPADPSSCLGWLLGAPLGHGASLLREVALLDRLGHAQRILCVPEAASALGDGLAGLARATLVVAGARGDAGGASAWLAAAAGCDVLYVGALGWQQARAVVALDDRDPAVAVVLDALGAGHVVRLLTGPSLTGLHRFGGDEAAGGRGVGGARPGGALAAEAARLLRSLTALGVASVGVEALGGVLTARSAAAGSFTRALGGLLGEKDVEQAASEGRRELRLPRATVVTPLARDRARALGIVIVRDDG